MKRETLFAVAVFFVLYVLIQWGSGAFTASLGAHPDASAHYMNTVLVRNFLLDGAPFPAVPYAEKLYAQYPKVAFGHWPPLFYAAGGVWMLVAGGGKFSVFSLFALAAALFTATIWRTAREALGGEAAVLAAACGAAIVTMSGSVTNVMLELPLAVLVLWACLLWARFMDRPTLGNSLWFGIAASAAILTKGNGFALAFLPPIALLLAGRPSLLLRWRTWASALCTAALCAPWTAYALNWTTKSFAQTSGLRYGQKALPFYSAAWFQVYGIVLGGLALAGVCMIVYAALRRERSDIGGDGEQGIPPGRSLWASMAAAPVACLAMHLITPSGFEGRYLYTVLGPVCLLGALAVSRVAEFPASTNMLPTIRAKRALVFGLAAALIALELAPRLAATFPKPETGMRAAAEWILSDPVLASSNILVCCDAVAEGSLIAELALRSPQPPQGLVVARATKTVGDHSWVGKLRKIFLDSPEAVREYLERGKIQAVVFGTPDGRDLPERYERVLRVVEADGETWTKGREQGFPDDSRLAVYVRAKRSDDGSALTP